MKSNSQVLAEIRVWFTRWRRINPARHDAESWGRLVDELRQIIPPGIEETYKYIFNYYIAILEDLSQ